MEENNITVDKAVQTIKGAILRAQAQASQSSNAIQLSLYYGIGRYVSINLQQAHWGAKALDTISERLQRELPGLRGFSSGNLKKMRIFYEEWQCLSIGSPLANQLQQFENKIEEGIEIGENMPNNFPKAIPDIKQSMKTISMFKDEYLLDFINTENLGLEIEDIDERVVEQEIVRNMRDFILQFGKDFIFMGNQYRDDYVSKIGYDKFEQRTYLKYCNGAETFYTYDPQRRRLQNLTVNSGGNTIMDNAYTYDANSK